jgi:hypothetical protein
MTFMRVSLQSLAKPSYLLGRHFGIPSLGHEMSAELETVDPSVSAAATPKDPRAQA